ncbi:MAG: UDP-N-acetylglucosamine diphosphorylase [Opitutae bacterium]|nr:UDP-N-acetylglucosamine diphosphorylase [Opitutae bacterium]
MHAAEFFTLPESLAQFRPFFSAEAAPWTWLQQIRPALDSVNYGPPSSPFPPGVHVEGPVFIHPTAKLPHTATLLGPIWIGPNTTLLPGCYLRSNVIVGANCVIGHNAEIKNSLLMDGVQVPHRPYIGDSILGNGAHLGAGVVLSNLRLDQKNITVRLPHGVVDSGLRKFGAILGDRAEVGCNAVLNPGTLLGPRALVMPTITVGGYVAPATLAYVRQSVSFMPRRD